MITDNLKSSRPRRRTAILRSAVPLLLWWSIIWCSPPASGDVLVRLTNLSLQFLDNGLQYSPDGSRIAMGYVGRTSHIGVVATLDTTTHQPLNILYSGSPDSGAHTFCWDADGSHLIISMMSSQTRNWDLYRGSIFGGTLEHITNTTQRDEYYPKMSHDGLWLVYAAEEYGSGDLDIRLRNMQTGWDSLIYYAPNNQEHFSWNYNDTSFAFETSFGAGLNIYRFDNPPCGGIYQESGGEDPCWAPYGVDMALTLRYTNPDLSDIWMLLAEQQRFYNLTVGFSQIDGLKCDPDWSPSLTDNRVIFIKKEQVGNVYLGDAWMIFDIDLKVPEPPLIIPFQCQLGQPYPNPFNNTTTIPLDLIAPMPVRWEMYNILGQRIFQMSPGTLTPGLHRIVVQGDNLASGNYWVVISYGQRKEVRKLVLMK